MSGVNSLLPPYFCILLLRTAAWSSAAGGCSLLSVRAILYYLYATVRERHTVCCPYWAPLAASLANVLTLVETSVLYVGEGFNVRRNPEVEV